MPYVSKAQQGYLHAKKPKIAKKFDEHTTKAEFKKLPEHVKKKAKPKIKGKKK